MVYVTSSPACTVAGVAVLVRTRSASVTTSVTSSAVLLEDSGSGVVVATVAVFLMWLNSGAPAPTATVMTMVTLCSAPTRTLPSEQDTVREDSLHVRALVVTDTKVVRAGSGSDHRHVTGQGRPVVGGLERVGQVVAGDYRLRATDLGDGHVGRNEQVRVERGRVVGTIRVVSSWRTRRPY